MAKTTDDASQNLKQVFMLVDFRHKLSNDDIMMYNFLKYYNNKVTIVATKYDKVSKNARNKQDKLIADSFELQEEDNIVCFSSVTKKGREEIYSIIEESMASK